MSSDAFSKIAPCKVYEKSSGCIFAIYVFKNEAACREVQTHSGCSPLARFMKKVLGAISRFMCPKSKRFAVEFRRILEVFALTA